MMRIIQGLKRLIKHIISIINVAEYPNISSSSRVDPTVRVFIPENLIMAENTNIDAEATIMNTRAKFIMKRNSGAAIGLTVVTGNHMSVVGMNFKQVTDAIKDKLDTKHQMDRDVVVEEDCWIASNVTLLAGVNIGRGG